MGRVISILHKLVFKLVVLLDGMVSGKKVFLESSHRIDTLLDVVV